MSNEKIALAITEMLVKNKIVTVPSDTSELPFGDKGINNKFLDICTLDMVAVYNSALKAVSNSRKNIASLLTNGQFIFRFSIF